MLALRPKAWAAPAEPSLSALLSSDSVLWMTSADQILDYIWEHGHEVDAVAVPEAVKDSLDIYHLVDLIERDWPRIGLVWLSVRQMGHDGEVGAIRS